MEKDLNSEVQLNRTYIELLENGIVYYNLTNLGKDIINSNEKRGEGCE